MGNCHKEEERGGDAKVEPPRGRIWRTRQEGAAKDHNERAGGESVPIGRMKRGAHTGAWRDRQRAHQERREGERGGSWEERDMMDKPWRTEMHPDGHTEYHIRRRTERHTRTSTKVTLAAMKWL